MFGSILPRVVVFAFAIFIAMESNYSHGFWICVVLAVEVSRRLIKSPNASIDEEPTWPSVNLTRSASAARAHFFNNGV